LFIRLASHNPQLTRSSLHRCLERNGISRLPEVDGDKTTKKMFDIYPIGFFHIDLAEVRTAEGKLYLFVAIARTSKFAVVELVDGKLLSLLHRREPSVRCSRLLCRGLHLALADEEA
jgi:hypothetical protein